MATIAVLGLGLLGSGFALNLLNKGHTVRVWNRTPARCAPLVEHGAFGAQDAAEAVRGAERVHLILTADDAVDAVIAALRPGLGAGVPVFDHSTNRPDRVAERFTRLREQGVNYTHCPVFMSPADARAATGLLLFAGPAPEFEAARPALAEMTGRLWHVGERPDLAAVHKLHGNAVLITLAGLMGDLFAMGQEQGLNPEQVLALFEVFKPAGALPFVGARVARRGEGPPSFELSMARKDVRLMLECAGGPEGLVVLPAVAQAMDAALAQGHGDRDFGIYAWPRSRG